MDTQQDTTACDTPHNEAESALFTDIWTLMDAMPRHGAKHSMDAYLIAGHEFAISIHEAQVDHHKHLDNVADKLVDLMLTTLRTGARQGLTLTDIAQAVARKQA